MGISPSNCGLYSGVEFDGKPIYAMGFPELQRLKERCIAYRNKCRTSGVDPHAHYATLENAIDFYMDKFQHQGIPHAYAQFSELRQRAIGMGYTVPSLIGTMHVEDIEFACAALREAIAMATPLPGEKPRLTGELIAQANASLQKAISSLNAKYGF